MSPEGEAVPPIEHLVFSTRAARPASGTEFNREVVAASPGVTEEARAAFVRLADMTGGVLSGAELPPLWAFRRIGEESWLVVRALSLGLYRKGHHQLLVHGAVLPRETVDLLDGDPFLLSTDEARRAGFRFVEEHPEGRSELDPIVLDPGFAATARRLCVERLERLTETFRALDPAFPALFDAALRIDPKRGAPGGGPRPTALAVPEGASAGGAGLIEWLLLHLHPADRAELSFHSRYAYEQAMPFDLVGTTAGEVADLRRQLRGEVEVWTPEASGGSGPAPTLGARVRQARERSPGLLPRALESYYLTLLPGRHGTDVRRNPFHPLTPEEADLCLRSELGLPLDPAEEETRVRLSLRGDRSLARHAADLGDAWRRGTAPFRAHLDRLTAAADELRRLDLRRMPPVARPEERLGLLALVPALEPESDRLPDLWREIVPPGSLGDLLGLLRSSEEAEIGERVLEPWMAGLLRGSDVAGLVGQDAAWPEYLRWLGGAGRPVAPMAARVERALEELPDNAALDGYRRLERACADAGLPAFALRILFQREVPRLTSKAARIRLADGVAWLLREGEHAASIEDADPFLGPALGDPETAGAVLDALGEQLGRLAASADPEAAWARARRLLEAQPRPTLSRAAAPAAGAFVARLALSPLADRAAEAVSLLDALGPDASAGAAGGGRLEDRFRFRDEVLTEAAGAVETALHSRPPERALRAAPRGLSSLLALRLEPRPLGEPDSTLDRALLDALLPALVLRGPETEGGAKLRAHLDLYLDRLLGLGRLHRVAAPAGPWRHLLLDELSAERGGGSDDPVRRAYLHLAWARWSSAPVGRDRTGGALSLARGLIGSSARPDHHAHRALLERTVPPRLHPEAHRLLAALLPSRGGDRSALSAIR